MAAISPARTKYRKSQKGSRAGNAKRGNTLAFGEFGLQSLSRGPMTGQQIEAARVTISRHLKRKGKLWIRVFPHKPVTKKPAEVRMGQGKGPVEFYVAVIKPGAVLFELAGVPLTVAKEAFRLADAKLPFHCRFISSGSGDKSVKVTLDYKTPHPLYQKVVKRQTVLHVHDEKNEAKVGDKVEVMETRPISRLKRWRIVSVLQKAVTAEGAAISET